jgi:hypothetical protein
MIESAELPKLAADDGKYPVGPILRACKLLQAFRSEGESLSLRELVLRTGPGTERSHRLRSDGGKLTIFPSGPGRHSPDSCDAWYYLAGRIAGRALGR